MPQCLCPLFRLNDRKSLFAGLLFVTLFASTMHIVQTSAVSWSEYETRLTTQSDFDGMSYVIETDNRVIWAFWTRNEAVSFDLVYATSTDEGLTWSQETPLTTAAGDNTGVSAMQTVNGVIWVVWASSRTGNFELFFKTSADLGSSWSNDTQLTHDPSRDLKPAVCQTANGSVLVVWSSNRSGDYDIYYKISSDGGASWSDDMKFTVDLNNDKAPSILKTRDGNLWVFWSSDRTGDFDVFYKIYNGSTWSNATNLLINLPANLDIDSNPFAIQTLDNKIYVFWSSRKPTQTATDDIFYEYSSDNGATWSPPVLFASSNYDDLWPSAIQTRDTKILVTWTSNKADQPEGNWDIYVKASLVGDINQDGVVDILDLSQIGMSYGTFEGEPGYDSQADLNCDGLVDIRDISLAARNYGAT